MPKPRRPYFHFNTLRTEGQFPRLTSTYTEELGHVTPAEPRDAVLPKPALVPWGVTQRETEYLKEYSAEMLRHPQYNPSQLGTFIGVRLLVSSAVCALLLKTKMVRTLAMATGLKSH
jgi:hypothetical protein